MIYTVTKITRVKQTGFTFWHTLYLTIKLITFRVSVCLSAAACPHYCTDPDVTWGSAPSCALLGGFAIGARVALLYGNTIEMRGRAQR